MSFTAEAGELVEFKFNGNDWPQAEAVPGRGPDGFRGYNRQWVVEAPMSWGRTASEPALRVLTGLPGCTDPEASNFDANATLDGSCLYAVVFQVNLSEVSQPRPRFT